MQPHLDGWLRNLGQRMVGGKSTVARGEDPVVPNRAQVVIDHETTPGTLDEAPVGYLGMTADASTPDDDIGLLGRPVGEGDRIGLNGLDARIEPNVDAALLDLLQRVVPQPPRERGQQVRSHFDQHDSHPVRIDLGIGDRQALLLHLCQCPGHLDTGRPAPDDHHRHAASGIGHGERLDAAEHQVADLERLRPGIDCPRMFGGSGDAEIVRPDADRQDEVVIGNRLADIGDHPPLRAVDRRDGRAPEPHRAAETAGERSQRIGDVARIQPAGGDLIEQGLEGRIGVAVDQGDRITVAREFLSGPQPTESTTDHHHVRLRHEPTVVRASSAPPESAGYAVAAAEAYACVGP